VLLPTTCYSSSSIKNETETIWSERGAEKVLSRMEKVHGEVGKSLTRMGVGFWCEVIPVDETTLLLLTMLFEIWLRSPSVEIAEPDDAGRLMRYKKELATPELGFAVRFVHVITKVERWFVLTRGTKLISQDFPAVRKKVW